MSARTVSNKRNQPPHNLEAERAVLGSVLLDNGALNTLLESVGKDDFFSPSHRLILEQMLRLSENNRTIDLVTLSEELSKEGKLEKVGGAPYIASLTDGVPVGSTASVTEYARIVKEKSTIRRLIDASNNVISRCLEGTDDPETLLAIAHEQLAEISGERKRAGFLSPNEIIKTRLSSVDALFSPPSESSSILTGFTDYDAITQGLHPGEMVVIAARPSLGKTALALNIAAHVSIQQGRFTAIASLEMTSQSILQRLLCSEARVNSHRLRMGFLSREDMARMAKALSSIMSAKLVIDDSAAVTPRQLRNRVRALKQAHPLELLIVDYLQLMGSDTRMESRVAEVGHFSSALKNIAKDFNICVLALSQLSRASEVKGRRAPQLSDLRDSGGIEQDADNVTFIHSVRNQATGTEDTRLIIGKQRNGPTGIVPVVFLKPYVRFENACSGGDLDS
jgi:replicative DNA helicase